MTTTIEAPSDVTSKKSVAATPEVPIELLGRTTRELSAQIALRSQLDIARSRLIGAREELAAAEARVGTEVPVNADGEVVDADDRGIVGYRKLGAQGAGVVTDAKTKKPGAKERLAQVERDVQVLEAGIWDVDGDVLERARSIAEEYEAQSAAGLQGQLDEIQKDRDRCRAKFNEYEALLAAATRELEELDVRGMRDGANVAKDVARLEEHKVKLEHQVRAGASVLKRTNRETEPRFRKLTSAIEVAKQREAAEQEARELAELSRKIAARLRRLVDAVNAVYREEAALTALRSDLPTVRLSGDLDRGGLFRSWAHAMLERLDVDA